MIRLLVTLISLFSLVPIQAQIKMAQLPIAGKKDVIFTYDSLTNVKYQGRERADYYKHLVGQKIMSVSSSDYRSFIKFNKEKDVFRNESHLKRMDGRNYYIDSIAYDHIDGDVFFVSEENNADNKFSLSIKKQYEWVIDIAWVNIGYFEKIKDLYLGKELVYVHKDENIDIATHLHETRRFMDYNTTKNLAKKIPCNSIWKCTDILVLPGKMDFGDCENRVILNVENEQYGKYYIFASYLLDDRVESNFLTMEDFHKYQAVQNQLRAVAKAKAAKVAEEAEIRAKERRDNIISKYGNQLGGLILQGRVIVGMTKEQCIAALGRPTKINRTTTATMVHEQWVYSSKYLYFENDQLVAIQD